MTNILEIISDDDLYIGKNVGIGPFRDLLYDLLLILINLSDLDLFYLLNNLNKL